VIRTSMWLLTALTLSAADYYVSPRGDDAGPGSQARPWRSIDRANRLQARPGDRILFEGGAVFAGNLVLSAEDAGTPGRPVTIGSYGKGRARLDAGAGSALLADGVGGLIVENLQVSGAGFGANTGSGIRVIHTRPAGRRLFFIRIRNVEASGFGRAGIFVGGLDPAGAQYGFEDVRIENCEAHHNVFYGILVAGPWDDDHSEAVTQGPQDAGLRSGYTNREVRITGCRAWRNAGDPDYRKNHSGNGILLADTDGGLIERCTAWENGRLCTKAPGGPCGIWAAGSNRVTIQFCESYRNHTGAGSPDGDGFDFDGGMTNSVMQYNYSHDNDGYGYLLYNYPGAPHPWANNVLRYNISDNDGRAQTPNSGIEVAADEPLSGLEIHHNTVLMDPGPDGNLPTALRMRRQISKVWAHHNLLVAGSGCRLVDLAAIDSLRLEENAYWSDGAPLRMVWGNREYSSLEAWRQASGQETRDGAPVGLVADPMFTLFGRGMVLDGAPLSRLGSYLPGTASPLRQRGLGMQMPSEKH
jgi:hypothetical protein